MLVLAVLIHKDYGLVKGLEKIMFLCSIKNSLKIGFVTMKSVKTSVKL